MPMKAMFQCDACEKHVILKGNISKAMPLMLERGWSLGRLVYCPACVGAAQQSPSQPLPTASAAPATSSSRVEPKAVYTDGSCLSNPGDGGWAWATAESGGSAPSDTYPTTNQRMEIQAAIEGLKAHDNPVHLYTDSRYVVDCITKKWYQGWMKRGWLTANKEPVKNRDLWEQLVEQLQRHPDLQVTWVKGHANTELNNKADELARAAATQGKAARERR